MDKKKLNLDSTRCSLYARVRNENKYENRINQIECIENRLKTNCAAENAEPRRDEEEIYKKKKKLLIDLYVEHSVNKRRVSLNT